MSDKEYQFWKSLGEWWRSTSGGKEPSQEFTNLAESSVDLGRQILNPPNPIWTETNSDEGVAIIVLFFGMMAVFKGGKRLLGLDWYDLITLVAICCLSAVVLSEIWRFYIQPFLTCLL